MNKARIINFQLSPAFLSYQRQRLFLGVLEQFTDITSILDVCGEIKNVSTAMTTIFSNLS
jgi:hypothetical protein